MKLIYCDGSTLTCSTIECDGKNYICDDYRIVPVCDIDEIVEDED